MSEPLNRKQVEMLAICICSQGGEGYRSISGPSLQDWLDTDAALRAELEARVTDVLNADKLVDSLTAENERLTKDYAALKQAFCVANDQIDTLQQDKADSQDANTKLRTELDELRIDMRSEQRMSEDLEQQLAIMTAENADLRAMGERLLARLSEGKVMIDDITNTPEEQI